MCQPQTVTLIAPLWLHDVRPSSNQKGVISVMVCFWHMRISLRIRVTQMLWDFDFLWGLAPGCLDGLSIGRYKKNRKSFDLYAVKFESGAMPFWGENRPGAGTLSKQGFHPCPSIIKKSQRRTQIHSKSLKKTAFKAKGRLYTTGELIQRLFIIDLYIQLAIYGYRRDKR